MPSVLKALLRELLDLVTRPGPLYVLTIGETMADKIQCKVLFPPVTDADTETRKLTVVVNGGTADVHDVAKTDTEKAFEWDQGATVDLSLVDYDDATPPNASPASTLTFVVTDTFAPAQPGTLGVQVVGETPEPPA